MKIRPKKNISSPYGILYRPEFFSSLIFTTAQVVFITAKIASVFISFIIVFAVGTNLKPRVILAPFQQYGRQRMTSGRDRRMD